jgi:hypothetical protein
VASESMAKENNIVMNGVNNGEKHGNEIMASWRNNGINISA